MVMPDIQSDFDKRDHIVPHPCAACFVLATMKGQGLRHRCTLSVSNLFGRLCSTILDEQVAPITK